MRPGIVRIAALIVALDLIAASSFQLATGATTPLLTTSLVPKAPSQTTFQGNPAVVVNYNDTLPGSTLVIVWLIVHNSLGQTVDSYVATGSMKGGQAFPIYVIIFGLSPGHYDGALFAVTSTGVPISVTSTLSISV